MAEEINFDEWGPGKKEPEPPKSLPKGGDRRGDSQSSENKPEKTPSKKGDSHGDSHQILELKKLIEELDHKLQAHLTQIPSGSKPEIMKKDVQAFIEANATKGLINWLKQNRVNDLNFLTLMVNHFRNL